MSPVLPRVGPLLFLGGCVLIVGPPADDTGDPACPEGTVAFTPTGGTPEDLTATFAEGTASAPVSYTVDTEGTLAFCAGTFHASLVITAAEATITGVGADETTLSGGESVRIVHHQGSEALSLSGLTLTLGSADHGAAVLVDEGEIEASDCVFFENDALIRGGAVAVMGREAEFTRCTFDDNESGDFGGALFSEGEVTLTDTTFVDNECVRGSPGLGGAVCVFSGATVVRTTFQGNESRQRGGGLFSDVLVDITDSVFAENRSEGLSGAGLAVSGGSATLTDTVFENNTAFEHGGGAHFSGTDVTCTRTADARGGFYGNQPGVLFIDLGDDTFISDRCDWGEGAEDNSIYDLGTVTIGGTQTDHTFGDDESFTCDGSTCTATR